jgi:hypothetical protein
MVVSFAMVVSPAMSQVPGPGLDRGAVDIGIGVRFFDRDVRSDNVEGTWSPSYHLTGAFIRYGARDWLALSAEVAAANTHALERQLHEENGNGRYLLLAIGAQAEFARGPRWAVGGGVHATRSGFLSRESSRCNERDTEWLVTLHGRRELRWGSHRVNLWGGPAWSAFELDVFGGDCSGKWESTDNWGAIAGVDALWAGRVCTFVRAVYIQHLQPRVGIALRLD